MQPPCSKPAGTKQQLCMLVYEPGNNTTSRVKLSDVVCWRALEGRSCISVEQLRKGPAVQVVLIPIPSPGQTSASKRRGGAVQLGDDGWVAALAAASAAAVTADKGDGSGLAEDTAAAQQCSVWDQLVQRCKELQSCLLAGRLSCLVDDDARQTPGSKFNKWEHMGVKLRVEIGARELATNTACIAVHPTWRQHAQAVLFNMGLLTPSSGSAVTAAGSSGMSAHQQPRGESRVLRVRCLNAGQLLDACQTLYAAHATSQADTVQHATSSEGLYSVWSNSVLDAADLLVQEQRQQTTAVLPHPHCTKLHMWPGCNAPHMLWSDAGLLPLLPSSCSQHGAEPQCSQASECQQLQPQQHQQHQQHLQDGHTKQLCTAAVKACSGGSSTAQQLVCAGHVRHLCGVAQACHCTIGHMQLLVLQQHVAQLYQQQARGQVIGWIVPQSQQQPLPCTSEHGTAQSADWHQEEVQDSAAASDSDNMCSTDEEDGLQQQSTHVTCRRAQQGTALLVTGIPTGSPAAAVRPALIAMLDAAGICQSKVRVSRARNGGTLGWARVVVPTREMAAQAMQLLNGSMLQLWANSQTTLPAHTSLEGTAVQGAASKPSKPSIHPATTSSQHALPACRIWVSPSCGRKDTLFCNVHSGAVRSCLRVDSVASFSITDAVTAMQMARLLAAILQQLPQQQTAHSGKQVVDGWVAIDGTACAGGNTLALAQVCSQVLAVEQHADRAEDLLFNLRLLGHICPPQTGTGSRQQGVVGSQHIQGSGGLGRSCTQHSHVRVLCGDFTQLWPHLPNAHVLLLDPPWGGPDYKQQQQQQQQQHRQQSAKPTDAAGTAHNDSHGSSTANNNGCLQQLSGCEKGSQACPQGPGLQLGDMPLCQLAGGLLASRKCDVLALKLPASGAQRHRELVACTAKHAASAPASVTSKGGVTAAHMHIWAVCARFGRTSLLIMVRVPVESTSSQPHVYGWLPYKCEVEEVQASAISVDDGTDVNEHAQALRSACRRWSLQEGVAYQVLGMFACTSSNRETA